MNDIVFAENLNFNFFTFEKQKYSDLRHGYPSHYIALMISGRGKIVSKSETIEVKKGDLFYIPKGLPYQSYWDSKDKISWLSFGFQYFPEATSKHFSLQKIECAEKVKQDFEKISMNSLGSSVIGAFYSALSSVVDMLQFTPDYVEKELVEKASKYIYENPDCSVLDIANHCLVSKTKLYDVFKKENGLTPNELIRKIRCKRAETLLSTTDKSVQEISDMLSFSSTSYFRKVLYEYSGKTPSQIRKENKM